MGTRAALLPQPIDDPTCENPLIAQVVLIAQILHKPLIRASRRHPLRSRVQRGGSLPSDLCSVIMRRLKLFTLVPIAYVDSNALTAYKRGILAADSPAKESSHIHSFLSI